MRIWSCALAALLVGGGLLGCAGRTPARPTVERHAASEYPGGSGRDALEFWSAVADQPLATHNDALAACLLFVTGDGRGDFARRVRAAKETGMVGPNYNFEPEQAVTVGELSAMLSRTTLQLGPEQDPVGRLVQSRVLPKGVRPTQGITGAQLVSFFARLDDIIVPARRTDTDPDTTDGLDWVEATGEDA